MSPNSQYSNRERTAEKDCLLPAARERTSPTHKAGTSHRLSVFSMVLEEMITVFLLIAFLSRAGHET